MNTEIDNSIFRIISRQSLDEMAEKEKQIKSYIDRIEGAMPENTVDKTTINYARSLYALRIAIRAVIKDINDANS